MNHFAALSRLDAATYLFVANSTTALRLTLSRDLHTLERSRFVHRNPAGSSLMPMQALLRHLRFLIAVQLLPALESGEETLVGGQAVLEGVMMRSPHAWGISV